MDNTIQFPTVPHSDIIAAATTAIGATVATPEPPTRSKPPYRIIRSDDCVITVNGVQYYPHAGEQVAFVAAIRLDTLLMAMRLQNLQGTDLSTVGGEEAAEFAQMFSDLCIELAQCIRGWSWTGDEVDESGEYTVLPWPSSLDGRIAVLRGRSMDEIMWLVGAAFGGGASSEPAGNATGA